MIQITYQGVTNSVVNDVSIHAASLGPKVKCQGHLEGVKALFSFCASVMKIVIKHAGEAHQDNNVTAT